MYLKYHWAYDIFLSLSIYYEPLHNLWSSFISLANKLVMPVCTPLSLPFSPSCRLLLSLPSLLCDGSWTWLHLTRLCQQISVAVWSSSEKVQRISLFCVWAWPNRKLTKNSHSHLFNYRWSWSRAIVVYCVALSFYCVCVCVSYLCLFTSLLEKCLQYAQICSMVTTTTTTIIIATTTTAASVVS